MRSGAGSPGSHDAGKDARAPGFILEAEIVLELEAPEPKMRARMPALLNLQLLPQLDRLEIIPVRIAEVEYDP